MSSPRSPTDQEDRGEALWSRDTGALLRDLSASPRGLSAAEAAARLERYGANALHARARGSDLGLFLSQFRSPVILLLLAAALLSLALGDSTDALVILAIVAASGALGFWQERGARDAVAALLRLVRVEAAVVRDGAEARVPFEEVVPGDVAVLVAGSSVPGDCRVLESSRLFVDESALSGESYPVEKTAGVLPPSTPLARRTNVLHLGTNVVSGTARVLVVSTGGATEMGRISAHLRARGPETEFEHGIRRFGYFLMEVTLVLVLLIFMFNVYLARPVLDSFLFALALAVGLTPQLLPAIISVNLSHGARRMAARRVIVKRLASIENFGSMNVLCSDKTGTLTEGKVRLRGALDPSGGPSDRVLRYAAWNAALQTSFPNPIDEAVKASAPPDLSGVRKLDEVPYDFTRKRLSVLVEVDGKRLLVCKGALKSVLAVCGTADGEDAPVPLDRVREQAERVYREESARGMRVLGVAHRVLPEAVPATREAEAGMTFAGFLLLHDPPKEDAAAVVRELQRRGVSLKMITGDNPLVAASIGAQVGLTGARVLRGEEIQRMSDTALVRRAGETAIFAEVEPNQKERILVALRRAGDVVGYLGDGINDAPALHAADVGISVNTGADVAKQAADIVLLDRDLGALARGVEEGRTTFANTLKYVFMATSANFGNMFSMAGASLLLPFLPLLPKQILLTNLLTDVPEMTIATDCVDPELVARPRRWDIRFIRRFMLVFGLLSSVFDYLTFGVLHWVLRASPTLFRTGWFVESVVSATLVVLVVRTRRPVYRARPSAPLGAAVALVAALVLVLPFLPVAGLFGFAPLPPVFFPLLGGIVALYVASAEVAKKIFFRRVP
jgi:Mg2+-importing ATPase